MSVSGFGNHWTVAACAENDTSRPATTRTETKKDRKGVVISPCSSATTIAIRRRTFATEQYNPALSGRLRSICHRLERTYEGGRWVLVTVIAETEVARWRQLHCGDRSVTRRSSRRSS